MLIEFRLANYRSIQKTQTFSMVAAKDNSLLESNCIESGIASIPHLTRSAVMYGPNAGGKSNLILGLAFMRGVVESSATSMREGQTFNISPFRFSTEHANQPSEFEVTFMENGIRYQYGFALNANRIVKEWLLAYPSPKAQRWFERVYDEKTNQDNWYLGPHLSGQKQLWKESTRGNALFLSTAVNLNSEQLRPIFNWFVNKLAFVDGNFQIDPVFTVNRILNGSEKSKVIDFLQAADLGIHDVQVETKIQKGSRIGVKVEPEKPPVHLVEEAEIPIYKITLLHKGTSNNKETVGFNITEESHGTQRLFSYAGPILDVLKNGRVLVVDELDGSLHPKMVRFLISLFHNPEINSNNAQLIFSTHNTSFLDTELFRRDQIWFVEKDREQASQLYPLTDFSPRKGEALEKGYLIGRYGALPFLGELKL